MPFGYTLTQPDAASLRYRCDVLAASEAADDAYGDPQVVPILTGIYCDIQDLRGYELLRASKISSKITHFVTTRYSAATSVIDAGMQLLWQGRTFNVIAVLDEYVPRKVFQAIYVEEFQARQAC